MLYIRAVYAIVRLSVCHVRVEDLAYCVKTLSRIAGRGRAAVPPEVSQIFPPNEKNSPL